MPNAMTKTRARKTAKDGMADMRFHMDISPDDISPEDRKKWDRIENQLTQILADSYVRNHTE